MRIRQVTRWLCPAPWHALARVKFGTPERLGFVSLTSQGHPAVRLSRPRARPEQNVTAYLTEFRVQEHTG